VVLEDDQAFLHWQERALRAPAAGAALAQACHLATSSRSLMFAPLPRLGRSRWGSRSDAEALPGARRGRAPWLGASTDSHTRHCRSCRGADGRPEAAAAPARLPWCLLALAAAAWWGGPSLAGGPSPLLLAAGGRARVLGKPNAGGVSCARRQPVPPRITSLPDDGRAYLAPVSGLHPPEICHKRVVAARERALTRFIRPGRPEATGGRHCYGATGQAAEFERPSTVDHQGLAATLPGSGGRGAKQGGAAAASYGFAGFLQQAHPPSAVVCGAQQPFRPAGAAGEQDGRVRLLASGRG